MNFSKKKIQERDAASMMVINVFETTKENWPTIKKKLEENFGENFIFIDVNWSSISFALAVLATDLQATKNLFHDEKAKRISRLVKELVNVGEYGARAKNEFLLYEEAFQEGLRNEKNPMDEVSFYLLQSLLGQKLENFTVSGGYVYPILILYVSSILCEFTGKWKKIYDNFELVDPKN